MGYMVSKKSRKGTTKKSTRKYTQRGGTYYKLQRAIIDGNVDLEQINNMLTESNLTTDERYMALMFAIMKNNVELVKILLQKYDIDVDRPNNDGYRPLPFAMEEGHAEIVILLLQKGANADDLNFDNFDFSDTNLHYIQIRNSSFKEAIFVNTILTNATLAECNFTQARMENTNLTNANMDQCDFTEARMENTKLTTSDIIESVFNNASISNTDFIEATLVDCVFNNATITNTDFSKATLLRVNMKGATISKSNFTNTGLTLADFNGATLNDNDLSNMDLEDEYDEETALLRERLLTTDNVTLQKSDIDPFIKSDLTGYDLIEGADIDLCSYIESDPNNVLFMYEGQKALIDKAQLRKTVNEYDEQIVFQCKNVDTTLTPRQENIIEGPHLNMRSIGLSGVMIPLNQITEVIVRDKQIFVIQSDSNSKRQQTPIASLKAILGGDLVGADHCREAVPIRIGNISYIDNETLQKHCVEKGLLVKQDKIGGRRRKTINHKNKSKRKRKLHKKLKSKKAQ